MVVAASIGHTAAAFWEQRLIAIVGATNTLRKKSKGDR
jgi:hypothetical protein